MSSLRGICPAKLNLALAVTGRRDDGYHTLRSVFIRLALSDGLAVASADGDAHDTLRVDGASGLAGSDNLVLRAAGALRERATGPVPSVRLGLTKRIPVAAGLGGGSSDAATTMRILGKLWRLDIDTPTRDAIALRLGADVPFFVADQNAALVEGIGELVRPLPPLAEPAGVLLVTPRERLSTAAVFAEFDRAGAAGDRAIEAAQLLTSAFESGLEGHGLARLASSLHQANDLWAPAATLSPGLAATCALLEARLQRAVLLSGSGPTLFAIYPSAAAAVDAAALLESSASPELAGAVITATMTMGGAHA